MMTPAYITLLQAGGGDILSFLPLVLMFVVVYFFMIRPQQKKQKEQKNFIANLKKGDNVITTGGIYGRIVEIDNDSVTLDIGKSTRMRVAKPFVSRENTEAELSEKN